MNLFLLLIFSRNQIFAFSRVCVCKIEKKIVFPFGSWELILYFIWYLRHFNIRPLRNICILLFSNILYTFLLFFYTFLCKKKIFFDRQFDAAVIPFAYKYTFYYFILFFFNIKYLKFTTDATKTNHSIFHIKI